MTTKELNEQLDYQIDQLQFLSLDMTRLARALTDLKRDVHAFKVSLPTN